MVINNKVLNKFQKYFLIIITESIEESQEVGKQVQKTFLLLSIDNLFARKEKLSFFSHSQEGRVTVQCRKKKSGSWRSGAKRRSFFS
jgi:hypothetical protein